MTYVKTRVRELLRRYDRQLVYLPPGTVTGADLAHDHAALIPGDGPVCLDVGANEGQTIALLQKALRNPSIHAFEPSLKTFRTLEAQSFGPRVALYNDALGECESQRELIRYASSDLSSFLPLDGDDQNRFRDVPIESRELVRVRTVDGFAAEQGFQTIDLLKVDAQGTDLLVLRGAERSLAAGVIRHVLVELNFVRMYEGQDCALEVLKFLQDFSMRLVDFYEKVYHADTLAW